MEGYRSRTPPAAVARSLRQEAGFGCAMCGHPYIEYHHIVPWAEEQHFRPEDMMAVCGNCHPAVSKLGKEKQYKIKEFPHNIKSNYFSGAMVTDKRDLILSAGSNKFINSNNIIQFYDKPLLSMKIIDGEVKISALILDGELHELLVINDNEISFRIDNLWDFKYHHNRVMARRGKRDVAIDIDFSKNEIEMSGNFFLGHKKISFSPSNMDVMGATFKNCTLTAGTVFQIGDPNVVLPTRCKI